MTRKDDSNDGKRPDRSVGGRREEAAAEGPLMRSEVVGREEARQERLVTMRQHPTRYDVSLWDRRRQRDGEDVVVDTKAVGNEQQRRLVSMRVQIEGTLRVECPCIHDGDANRRDKY